MKKLLTLFTLFLSFTIQANPDFWANAKFFYDINHFHSEAEAVRKGVSQLDLLPETKQLCFDEDLQAHSTGIIIKSEGAFYECVSGDYIQEVKWKFHSIED